MSNATTTRIVGGCQGLSFRGIQAAAAIVLLALAAGARANPCEVVDNGSGTVSLPPAGCDYLSPQEVHMIIDGLPPGTTIELAAIHREFICNKLCGRQGTNNPCAEAGGGLGGERECFDSELDLQLRGTGMLAGYNRILRMGMRCETHTAPRMPGDPGQSFDTDMFSMEGQLPPGDPDFDLLRITGGSAFGMPSPGHTTLTQLPNGNWNIDSFFDITYRIDFVGAPGGPLSGMSGSTTATIRMQAGDPFVPAFCLCKGDMNGDGAVTMFDAPLMVTALLQQNGDECADVNEDLSVDGDDIQAWVNAVAANLACPAHDAWSTPEDPALPSFYAFGGPNPPIPPGFFDPGSEPFNGIVELIGQPIDINSLGETDTIVRRPPLIGAPFETVPIEIVALNLVSLSPITVNNVDSSTTQWMVNVGLSDNAPPPGNMNITQTDPNGGVLEAFPLVQPVFVFTNADDLNAVVNGTMQPEDVRVRVLDTGDPENPMPPLQLQFGDGPTQAPFIRQVCPEFEQESGLFHFHNDGAGFIPGVAPIQDPFRCAFKPGPMRHVTPGESHYVQPPNNAPGTPRCTYDHFASVVFCRGAKTGPCPPAPAVLCTHRCPVRPCAPIVLRLVRTRCRLFPGAPANRGWCVQIYVLRPPPFDCAPCP